MYLTPCLVVNQIEAIDPIKFDTDASKRHWASGPLLMSKVVSLKKAKVFIENKLKFIEDT